MKRSKGRCKKSAPPHMLALGTSSFPQASGANTGSLPQHSLGMILQMGQRNQGLAFTLLYLHHSRQAPVLAGLFWTYSVHIGYQHHSQGQSAHLKFESSSIMNIFSPSLEKISSSNSNEDWIQAWTTVQPVLYPLPTWGQLKAAFLHSAISSLCLCTAIRKERCKTEGRT